MCSARSLYETQTIAQSNNSLILADSTFFPSRGAGIASFSKQKNLWILSPCPHLPLSNYAQQEGRMCCPQISQLQMSKCLEVTLHLLEFGSKGNSTWERLTFLLKPIPSLVTATKPRSLGKPWMGFWEKKQDLLPKGRIHRRSPQNWLQSQDDAYSQVSLKPTSIKRDGNAPEKQRW